MATGCACGQAQGAQRAHYMYTHRTACFFRNPGAPLTTPAFVFIGEQDALIVPAMSREAATVFASAQISSSPSTGHDLPQPGDPTCREPLCLVYAHDRTPAGRREPLVGCVQRAFKVLRPC
jgi:hypothetical protein